MWFKIIVIVWLCALTFWCFVTHFIDLDVLEEILLEYIISDPVRGKQFIEQHQKRLDNEAIRRKK